MEPARLKLGNCVIDGQYIHFAKDRRQALAEKAAKGISAAFTGGVESQENVVPIGGQNTTK